MTCFSIFSPFFTKFCQSEGKINCFSAKTMHFFKLTDGNKNSKKGKIHSPVPILVLAKSALISTIFANLRSILTTRGGLGGQSSKTFPAISEIFSYMTDFDFLCKAVQGPQMVQYLHAVAIHIPLDRSTVKFKNLSTHYA